jgi:hypothetical protein
MGCARVKDSQSHTTAFIMVLSDTNDGRTLLVTFKQAQLSACLLYNSAVSVKSNISCYLPEFRIVPRINDSVGSSNMALLKYIALK